MQNNNYYSVYSIISTAFGYKDIREGIEKSLYVSKEIFNASDVIIYRTDENDDYIHKFNQPMMVNSSSDTTTILNLLKAYVEDSKYYIFKSNKKNIKTNLFIPVFFENFKYVVAITYDYSDINVDKNFLNVFVDYMRIILSNYEKYKPLYRAAEIDSLTGLGNRSAYDKRIESIKLDDYLLCGLFDLFRLKNINDNYSHAYGDEYINKTAEILRRHFPKYFYTIDASGKKCKILTGTSLYRIGGDEFSLISNTESLDDVILKMLIIKEEVKNIDLNINEIFAINSGIVVRENNESYKELYKKADILLSEDKRDTYKVLGLDRRR